MHLLINHQTDFYVQQLSVAQLVTQITLLVSSFLARGPSGSAHINMSLLVNLVDGRAVAAAAHVLSPYS